MPVLKEKFVLVLTMAVLCRMVTVGLLWLPASCSKLCLCMCCPVEACVVSMRVPVGFIAITALVSIDLLTVLRCGYPRVTDECIFFLFHFLKGNQRGTLKRNDEKRAEPSFPSTPFPRPLPSNYNKILS